MSLPPLVLLAIGLVLLVVGAEVLVRGATRIALAAGLSRLVVGLVVVAIGTSAPEAAITTGAAVQGRTDLAVGNVVGSNTFNVLVILGLSALVAPLVVGRRLVRLDIPIMVGTSLLFLALALDRSLGRIEGILLLALAAGFMAYNVRLGRREGAAQRDGASGPDAAGIPAGDAPRGTRGVLLAAGLVVVGIAVLVWGAQWSVQGASELARAMGISDLVIGLTIVSAGTSLPEVATSVLAVIRGERDIAIGNIVGSCVLNITLVLGLAASVAPASLPVPPGLLGFDLPMMVAAAAAVLPMAFTGQVIARWEGAVFLLYYVAYIVYLALEATVHPAVEGFGSAIRWFVLPLTVIVLAAAVAREVRRRVTPQGGRPATKRS